MSTAIVKHKNGQDIQRGVTARDEFGGVQVQSHAETASAAVMARERALVEAHYLMAERHRRNWMDVRGAMLDHCKRPKFAEIARYEKPVGQKKVNGEWVDQFAKGFTVRFAETLTQEMGNVKPETSVTFEDDLLRIVRISVTDLEKNIPRYREVAIAKVVEKRGKKDKKTGEWSPPDNREVVGEPRKNSYGDMTYTVKATDDELRNKVNSEESKTQRDFIYKLCPRDILDECEEVVIATLTDEDKRDPEAAKKKLLDRFKDAFGLMPSDLETYVGRPVKQWSEQDRQGLIGLGSAIKDGVTTFDEALKARYATPEEELEGSAGGGETTQQHDARLQRQSEEQLANAKAKEAAEQKPKPETLADSATSADEVDARNRALDAEIAAKESGADKPPASAPRRTLTFGKKKEE